MTESSQAPTSKSPHAYNSNEDGPHDAVTVSNSHFEAIQTGRRVDPESIPAHFAPLSLRIVLVGWALGVLFGISVVYATPLFTLSGIRAALTGDTSSAVIDPGSESLSFGSRLYAAVTAPQLHLYLAAWATFHTLEFVVTAKWNATRLMRDSFLLQNGWNYHAAHLAGLLEFLLEHLFLSHSQRSSDSTTTATTIATLLTRPSTLTYLGFCLVVIGQHLRSTAMIHASSNFSHQVAHKKRDDHRLVTTGVYAWVRHPSYTGFFTWAIATQLVLANPAMTLVFAVVLWRFFSSRIRGRVVMRPCKRVVMRPSEEYSLVNFFGDEYRQYKRKVGSGIPFVA